MKELKHTGLRSKLRKDARRVTCSVVNGFKLDGRSHKDCNKRWDSSKRKSGFFLKYCLVDQRHGEMPFK